MVAVDIDELPRQDGVPVGQYRLRYDTISVTMFDCAFDGGVTTGPVSGRTALRLRVAFGSDLRIEPADDETTELVAAHLDALGRVQRAAAVRGQAFEAPQRPAPPAPRSVPPPVPPEALRSSRPPATHIEEIPPAEPMIDHDVDHIQDVTVLRSMAAGLGIEVDERWKLTRLRLEIRKAREGVR